MEAVEAAIAAIKPGVIVGEVDAAARKVIDRSGRKRASDRIPDWHPLDRTRQHQRRAGGEGRSRAGHDLTCAAHSIRRERELVWVQRTRPGERARCGSPERHIAHALSGLGVWSRSVGESAKLVLHSGRTYGPDTPWQRHDHARDPSGNTAIEGSAQRASRPARAQPKDGRQVA
ncbi:M24 family metallopeptidase [Bradyrhizobium sp. 33ap4]|uniref:M24 family metallopeptidase n=1 Tax=Bradyrhizobium sp. 33ap4 TaxID=3061630 RepID=UPI0029303225|nr:M24 family metallopeptidase [Bradyrhizobium sp. 33ap4]